MPAFSDYFSATAARYATYRPRYPESLFDWLMQHVPDRNRAWDCGTGTGQATKPLAKRFREVVATDPSEAQIAHAESQGNVNYAVATAEESALATQSVSLVTVAQALHWFDLDRFYKEVRRVVRPNGVIAVWTYALFSLGDEALDTTIRQFYTQTVGPFWPAERAIVDAGYRSVLFPFERLPVPAFVMQADWTIEHFAGYVGTWSAVTRYRKANGTDPVAQLIKEVAPLWGSTLTRRVTWPLDVLAGIV